MIYWGVICLLPTAIAVLIAIVRGSDALSLGFSDNHPDASSLKLIAANLLEPSVTILILLLSNRIFFIEDGIGLGVVLCAVPLTLMLLAPLFIRVKHPIHLTLMIYGLLRWANSSAIWIFIGLRGVVLNEAKLSVSDIIRTNKMNQSDQIEMIVSGLILLGTFILCISVYHLTSSLDGFKIQAEPITDPPETLKLEL
jgi:hypothetical protein